MKLGGHKVVKSLQYLPNVLPGLLLLLLFTVSCGGWFFCPFEFFCAEVL